MAHVQALAGDDSSKHPVNGECFVPLADLDECCPNAATPTPTAPPQSDDIGPPERRREQAVPKTPKRRRQSLLQETLEVILRRYYPQGVRESTSTSAVQQTVAAAWKGERQARGCKPTEPPSWDTIARRLGRRRD